jgi:hypothetical protein
MCFLLLHYTSKKEKKGHECCPQKKKKKKKFKNFQPYKKLLYKNVILSCYISNFELE